LHDDEDLEQGLLVYDALQSQVVTTIAEEIQVFEV
jgi:hypothetical protein